QLADPPPGPRADPILQREVLLLDEGIEELDGLREAVELVVGVRELPDQREGVGALGLEGRVVAVERPLPVPEALPGRAGPERRLPPAGSHGGAVGEEGKADGRAQMLLRL